MICRPLESAAAQADRTVSQMEQNEQDVKDYWRLVAVRESMTSMEFKDSRLDTLINNTRKLVSAWPGSSLGTSSVRSALPCSATTCSAAREHCYSDLPYLADEKDVDVWPWRGRCMRGC